MTSGTLGNYLHCIHRQVAQQRKHIFHHPVLYYRIYIFKTVKYKLKTERSNDVRVTSVCCFSWLKNKETALAC